MNSNLKGNIGEAKALQYYISKGYEVYIPFGTASICDLIILKDNVTERISVKTTTSKTKSGKYTVRLRQSKMNEDKPFNNSTSDILFVYIIPENRIVEIKSLDIKNKTAIVV